MLYDYKIVNEAAQRCEGDGLRLAAAIHRYLLDRESYEALGSTGLAHKAAPDASGYAYGIRDSSVKS